jgi:hypothetical protein
MSAAGGTATAAAAAAAPRPASATTATATANTAAATTTTSTPASTLYAEASRRDLAPGAHRRRVLAVAWAPGGRRLASAGADAGVRLWTIDPRASSRGERPDAELRGHGEPVTSVAFAPGRDDLLASCGGRCVRVWDARSQRSVATIPLPTAGGGSGSGEAAAGGGALSSSAAATATHLSWSPDGSQIAVALCGTAATAAQRSGYQPQQQQQQGAVALVDARRFRVARSFALRSPAGGLAFALPWSNQQQPSEQQQQQQQPGSGNGGAAGGAGAAAAAAAAGGGAEATAAGGAAASASASAAPTDRLLAGSIYGDLDALSLPSGDLIGSARGHCDAALCLAQSSGLVATGGNDGVVTVFDARAGVPLAALSMFDAPVRAVSLNSDGRLVAAPQPGTLEICSLDGVVGGSGGVKPAVLHSIPLQRSQGGDCAAVAFNPRFPGVLAFGDEARDGSGVVSVVVLSRGGGGAGTGAGPTTTAPLRALGGGSGGGGAGAAHNHHHNSSSQQHHHPRPPSSGGGGGGGMGGRPLPPAYPARGGGGW